MAALPRRRILSAWAMAAVALPVMTVVLASLRDQVHLPSVLLLYLLVVVAVAVVGGAWPAVAAAVAAFLLAQWWFTPPFHRFTIGESEDAVALVAFLVVAGVVSWLLNAAMRHAAAAEGNDLKTALLTAVSHDLRTPLASIKASVTSLQQEDVDWSDADRRDLLATIDEETDRLNGLVGNLLDMSRISTGALHLSQRGVGLDEVVPIVLASLGARGEGVVLDVPESLPRAWADPGLLERAIANVVDNALTWTGDEPVGITANKHGAYVELRVIDHGPGVDAAGRPHLFEPFQRLGDKSGTGVGLGLAVARGFLSAMGGAIDAEETPGGGLTMVLRVPWVLR